jgi:hypothetical protein
MKMRSPRFSIVDDVLTWPDLCECVDTPSCGFKVLGCLYEMQLSIVEHIADDSKDAKREARPSFSAPGRWPESVHRLPTSRSRIPSLARLAFIASMMDL